MNYKELAQRFQVFGEKECPEWSALYSNLALGIAGDEGILALAARVPAGQPVPNMFLAAVQFLLLQEPAAPLAEFYPSLTAGPASPEEAYPAFRAFCLKHADALCRVAETRRIQTNEVGRCTYLLPAFSMVSALAGGRPLAQIEIGTSAGLNLMWDHYGYHYGQEAVCGVADSPVQLDCEFRGGLQPPLPERLPEVTLKTGVDLHVIDSREPQETMWLRALVWPEHRERILRLTHALEITRRNPPRLLTGDGLLLLPELLHGTPADATLCVFHTHTINQWTLEARERLCAILAGQSDARDIYQVSAEWIGTPHPQLELAVWHRGRPERTLLANCDPHGRWVEWKAGK